MKITLISNSILLDNLTIDRLEKSVNWIAVPINNLKVFCLTSEQYDYEKKFLKDINVDKKLRVALKSRETLIFSYIIINPSGLIMLYNEDTKQEVILGDLKQEELKAVISRNIDQYDFLNSVILIILNISTVISVLEQVGWLPKKVRKYLKLSRSIEIIEILEELGMNVDKYRCANISINYPKDYSKESVEKQVRKSLKQITINKPISIGRNRVIKLESYIDLIGYSCDSTYACYYARLLSTYWAEAVKDNNMIKNPLFDFVVTHKGARKTHE